MSATTRVVDFPGAQLRATEVKGDKGLFTNVVINSVLAETATQTLDQVTANGATTTRAISITNARPGLTQTDAALTVSGGLGVNANVVATNLIARVDGSVSDRESVPHKHGLQLFAPGGSSANASLTAGYDPTADVGYVNAGRSGSMRPLCLQTLGDFASLVGVGTAAPTKKLHVYTYADAPLLLESGDRLCTMQMLDTGGGSAIQNDEGDVRLITGYDTSFSGGSEKFRVTSSGNVGLGTSSPNAPLDVKGANIQSSANGTVGTMARFGLGDGVLNVSAVKTSNGAETLALQTTIDNKTMDYNITNGWSYGHISRYDLCLQPYMGYAGVGTTNPITNFDVQTTSNANEPNNRIAFGNDSYWNYMYFGTTHPTSANGANTRVYFRAVSNGTSAPSTSSINDTVELYTNYIGYNGGSLGSDDRRKFNEVAIENACDTLNKLKPQVYDKHNFEFDEISIDEASNVSTEGYVLFNEKYVKRRVSDHSRKEAGLIAQDVFYDAPELRYLVKLSDDADPDEEKPETPEDIQDDPDYDAAGWGTESASIDYNSLIAYLVKANQELDARVRELEKKI